MVAVVEVVVVVILVVIAAVVVVVVAAIVIVALVVDAAAAIVISLYDYHYWSYFWEACFSFSSQTNGMCVFYSFTQFNWRYCTSKSCIM